MLTSHVYTKYTLELVALEKAEIDLHAFKQQALSSLIALQFKLNRPKVTGGEVGVSSDTIGLGLKQSSLGGTEGTIPRISAIRLKAGWKSLLKKAKMELY